MLQLHLKRFLKERGLNEERLADAIADVLDDLRPPVSERHLRYISSNADPLTESNTARKPSLVMLGFIIRGLRHLTGEEVKVSDVLEYVPGPDEVRPQAETGHVPGAALVRAVPLAEERAALLRLERLLLVRLGRAERRRLLGDVGARPRRLLAATLVAALLVAGGLLAYERLWLRPRLLQAGGLFSFRDRLQATSRLPVPVPVAPEGEVRQLVPILRAAAVAGAAAYEFYVENTVSGDAVYTGPVPQNSFLIPEGTLCPETVYTWRVRALGADGWTSFSSPLSFSVSREAPGVTEELLRLSRLRGPPATPVMVSPAGAVASVTPLLELEPDPDALGYGFYIRDLTTDAVVYNNNFARRSRVRVPEAILREGGVYQWNARSRNCHYWSAFTPVQIFTVGAR